MIKRILLLCVILLCTSAVAMSEAVGEWQLYRAYQVATQNIATKDCVYSLCNGNLLAYDTNDTSVRTYDWLNILNDVHISHMAYSTSAKCLMLVYDNGNIDLLDADDNVRNVAALKNSSLANKEIVSVSITGTTAYLTTGFGIVTIDLREGVVIESYRLGRKVNCALEAKGKLWISDDDGLYYADMQSNWREQSSWHQAGSSSKHKQLFVFDDQVYAWHAAGVCRISTNGVTWLQQGNFSFCSVLQDGSLIFGTPTTVHLYTDSQTHQVIEQDNNWQSVSLMNGQYWMSEGKKGLRGYQFDEEEFYMNVGSIQANSPMYDLSYKLSFAGERLLVAAGNINYNGVYNPPAAMWWEDGEWTNLDDSYLTSITNQRHNNFTDIVQDPQDPQHHFVGTFRYGMYEFRNGKFVHHYNADNSPLCTIFPESPNYRNYTPANGLRYDAEGNLWLLNSVTDTIIRYITPKGRWQSLYYSEIAAAETPLDYLFTSSGVNFMVSCRMQNRGFFGFIPTQKSRHILRSTIINQDGTSYAPDQFYCMTEDLDGAVWCGTNLGLFVIDDPTTYFNSDFRFNQIKIAREDGSGLADYLLSGVVISCIAVDGGNRKWIGTYGNGVYLVSADGQEMIHHFTTNNSPMPSDDINSITIDPLTGRVMIGTELGLCSYMGEATEAAEQLDADDVKAYPNPISPDYHGPITIDGLTEDAEVKICSSTGQVISSGRSNGGRFVWNGLTPQGRRVSSGVYQVISNTSAGKKAIVTRIIVIK